MRCISPRCLFSAIMIVALCLSAHAQTSVVSNKSIDESFSEYAYEGFIGLYSKGIQEKIYVQTDKPYYCAGEKIWFKAFLVNAITNAPMNNSKFIYVELIDKHNKLIQRIKIQSDQNGFHNSIELTPKTAPGEYTLRAYTQWMRNFDDQFFFYKKIEIVNPIDKTTSLTDKPSRSTDKPSAAPSVDAQFDVQFFPEGGDLIAGSIQTIAFKAIGADGFSREVSGKIFNNKGEELTNIETMHNGTGKLSMIPLQGDTYYAQITDKITGSSKRFDLPIPHASGCTLQVIESKGRIMYQVTATPDIDTAKLGIIVHSRGKIVAAEKLGNKTSKAISCNSLHEGINQLSVIDITTGTPISQRLFFVVHPTASAKISANKNNYNKRELATLTIDVKDSSGAPAKGSFGVSVTDRNTVKLDSLTENIYTYLLLSSDLRGYIEQPASYFNCDKIESKIRLNNLMLTQGWTRFDIGKVLKREYDTKEFSVEQNHTISGEVKGFFGNAARNPNLVIYNPVNRYFDQHPLTTNKFTLNLLDYPDSSNVIIQAIGKSGSGRTLSLNIKEQTFPKTLSYMPLLSGGRYKLTAPESFLYQSTERYYYEGGMRVIDMEAVTVTTEKPKANSTMYNMTPSRSMSKENVERYAHMSIINALSTLPGVSASSEGVSIRGSQDLPLFYVDEMAVDFEQIRSMNMTEVESLDLVTGPEAGIFGLGASGGVVLIGLKSGASLSGSITPLPSLANICQLGYKRASAFYTPMYEVPTVHASTTPDLRTTILWNPCVATDSTGVTKITFYTADKPSVYDIILEGVTENGEIIRQQTSVTRE